MPVVAVILTVFAGLVGLEWILRNIFALRVWRKSFHLTPQHAVSGLSGCEAGGQADPPLVSVVVAAKDEQANIEACLRSILAQDYPNFEVIVSNDRSVDATGAIVERIAAGDARLSLINIDELPEG